MKTLKLPRRAIGVVVAAALIGAACSKADTAATGSDDSSAATNSAAGAGGDTASEPAAESRVNLPVVAEEVRVGDLVLTVNTTGQVRSDAEAKLKAEVTGTVQTVHVRPGDRVSAGQPIITFDQRPFDLAVRTAEIALQESMLRAQDNYVPDSIVSGQAPTPERRRNAELRNGVDANRVRLDQAKLDRERSVIIAPFNGVVDKVSVAAGERLTGGGDIAVIVDVQRLRIEAAVLEHDLPLVKVGGQASVSSAASPNVVASGRVIAVLPLVDSTTRAGRAYIRLTGNGVLRPGMYADLRLEATRLAGRTIVPDRAVIERDGRPLVFVVRNGRAQWVYVNPGRSNGREREILADSTTGQIPIAAGDMVITEGHLTLTHDAPVRVVSVRETGRP
ncbi:MAG: efflux RND transporter periplasmic adaptor subunit [Gemmatimonadetes bacterium]|nr:efflux RND transporter periplasmic adaptor subunit [Gemmatimonadota bacterium]